MNYTKFKDFLVESEIIDFSDLFYQSNKEILDNIIKLTPEDSEYLTDLLDSLSEDDLDYLGLLLFLYFDETYSDDDWLDDDVDYSFTTRDIIGLVYSVGTDALDAIDFILNYELDPTSDTEDELDIQVLFDKLDDFLEDSETLSEAGISKRMKITDMNKALKYMTTTKAKLRATAAERRKENRKNRQKNRRNYRVNKRKIAMYQKSRRDAIKKGKHQVKKRR